MAKATGSNTYTAFYYLNDRLGNHRIVIDATDTARQVNNYYPSGTSMAELPRQTDQGVQPYKFGGKELDRFNTLDLYDFEARVYDPVLMRFTRTDPMAEKYPGISPYAYCANNPIRNIDLRGDSITVLNLGSGTNQHMSMLIQNDAGKWQYFSVNGDNVYSSGKHTGGKEFDDLAVGEWDSPQKFMDSYYNQAGGKDDKDVNSYGFAEGYVIPSTPEQDNVIRTTFTDNSKNDEYRLNPLNPNHCATVTQKSLNAAGIETRVTNVSNRWGERFEVKVNPYLPSDAYKAIIRNNPNGYRVNRTKL